MALYGQVQGQRERGRPKKRWIDYVREECAEMSLDTIGATRLVSFDRDEWRRQVLKLPEHAIALPGP